MGREVAVSGGPRLISTHTEARTNVMCEFLCRKCAKCVTDGGPTASACEFLIKLDVCEHVLIQHFVVSQHTVFLTGNGDSGDRDGRTLPPFKRPSGRGKQKK